MSTANHYPPDDDDYQSYLLESFETRDGWWDLHFDGNTSFMAPVVEGITPRVGSALRFYPGTFGRIVRGLYINGHKVFYRPSPSYYHFVTPEETPT